MQNRKLVLAEIETLRTIKFLAQAYEEIAVMRIQKAKTSVLYTRNFVANLSKVFFDVKSSYQREITKALEKSKKKDLPNNLSVFKKNGRTALVLISANTKLYGDIIKRIYDQFLEAVNSGQDDAVIIGKFGKGLYDQEKTKREYAYFELPDMKVTLEDLKPLIEYLAPFEKVKVFYGKFANVVTQLPATSSISGEEPLETQTAETDNKTYFAFEPSLESILQFFETSALSALFKQTADESELARLASRVMAMEDALMTIEKKEDILWLEQMRTKKILDNRKQIEVMAGSSLWGGK